MTARPSYHYHGQETSKWKLEAQQNFWRILYKKISDADTENELKETFPVFSKYNEDEDRIMAEELKLVLTHLLGKVENTKIFHFFTFAPSGRLQTRRLMR